MLIAVILIAVFLLAIFSVAPLDRSPVTQSSEYKQTMSVLDSLENSFAISKSDSGFLVGFSKVNITPSFEAATAGYGKRLGKTFTSVRDSIYVRTILINNGVTKVAIVTADLMIIPPTVTSELNARVQEIGLEPDQVFLGATHSHNSVGNWGEGIAQILYGKYSDRVIDMIADGILESIKTSIENQRPSQLSTKEISLPDVVDNRLINGGEVDPLLRLLSVQQDDGTKLLLMNFTAHATCLYASDLRLSGDYPATLVKKVEGSGYDFAMFMAGAVGSHRARPPDFGDQCIEYMGDYITKAINLDTTSFRPVTEAALASIRVPLELPDPQIKLTGNLKARSWLFRMTFGEYPVFLSGARIGDLVLLGTPCDYSGEFMDGIDSTATSREREVFVSSFNGGYIGYVTPVEHYDVNHYETQLMNWYPPGTGEYITEALQQLLFVLSR